MFHRKAVRIRVLVRVQYLMFEKYIFGILLQNTLYFHLPDCSLILLEGKGYLIQHSRTYIDHLWLSSSKEVSYCNAETEFTLNRFTSAAMNEVWRRRWRDDSTFVSIELRKSLVYISQMERLKWVKSNKICSFMRILYNSHHVCPWGKLLLSKCSMLFSYL